jgi:hypothetical protein
MGRTLFSRITKLAQYCPAFWAGFTFLAGKHLRKLRLAPILCLPKPKDTDIPYHFDVEKKEFLGRYIDWSPHWNSII